MDELLYYVPKGEHDVKDWRLVVKTEETSAPEIPGAKKKLIDHLYLVVEIENPNPPAKYEELTFALEKTERVIFEKGFEEAEND